MASWHLYADKAVKPTRENPTPPTDDAPEGYYWSFVEFYRPVGIDKLPPITRCRMGDTEGYAIVVCSSVATWVEIHVVGKKVDEMKQVIERLEKAIGGMVLEAHQKTAVPVEQERTFRSAWNKLTKFIR